MWRNFGIVLALWALFLGLLFVSIERLPAAGSDKTILLYKRGSGGKFVRAQAKKGNERTDPEAASRSTPVNGQPTNAVDEKLPDVHAVET